MSKTLYFVSLEDIAQGMFDESGTLLTVWSPNDADWRNDYFKSFMQAVDVTVIETRRRDLVQTLFNTIVADGWMDANEYDIDDWYD